MLDIHDQHILITGANGFLGHAVCDELHNHGYRNLHKPASFYLNLLHRPDIDHYLRHHKIYAVIHLAGAVGGLQYNKKYPGKLTYRNLSMGVNLIDSAYKHGVERFIMTGTTCSYPERPKTIPFVEQELFGELPEKTNAGYGYAKRMMMLLLKTYHQQYEFESTTLVPTNLYGPYDEFDEERSHVIPGIIKKFENARKLGRGEISLWGDGSATRDFLYVGDVARGIRLALEQPSMTCETLNLGSGSEVSIRELAKLIRKAGNYSDISINFSGDVGNGQPRRVLNVDKASEILNWKPSVGLMSGLESTIEWYRNSP